MLWLSRKDIEHISRRLLRDYLKKVPQKVDHIDPTDFAEKMCGLQFTFADISEAHDAIGPVSYTHLFHNLHCLQ